MSTAFSDYYRCASELGEFGVTGDLSPAPGFFSFGGAVCYGRSNGGGPPSDRVTLGPDVSDHAKSDAAGVRLPFDLSDVVDNLRLERYALKPADLVQRFTAAGTAQSVYYFLRPMLPVSVRRHLQKARLRGWDHISFPQWPVDFTVETLMERAMALRLQASGMARVPFIWFWPHGAPSCTMMTHDVEGPEGRDFCDQLMDVNDHYGVKSSFQLIPEERYEVSPAFVERLRARGFEVNVHDLCHDGRLFLNRDQFEHRAARINHYAATFQSRGFRAGAMYRQQGWFDALEFSYDMSVPNVAHLEPQRGGCCTVMPYFIGNVLELPLTTIQDYSLFHILDDYSISLWKTQIDLIMARHGLISFITHPDYLIEPRARAVYKDLLTHLRSLREDGKVWSALPGEVDRWWRARSQMTLVDEGNEWRIDGPESHRARLAHAALEEGRVVYTLDAGA